MKGAPMTTMCTSRKLDITCDLGQVGQQGEDLKFSFFACSLLLTKQINLGIQF